MICKQISSEIRSPKHGTIHLTLASEALLMFCCKVRARPLWSCMKQPGASESAHVLAAFMSDSLSLRSTGMATFCRISEAFSAAVANESEITVGWTPLSRSSRHFRSSAPQMTVTDVVPSPAATSCTSKDAAAFYFFCMPVCESSGC